MSNYYLKAMTTAVAIACAAQTQAQIPDGYYETLRGKKGEELKTAVHEVIKTADVLEYGSGKGRTWDGFYTTDRTDDNHVTDRYSNGVWVFGEKGASVSGMNIEHSFPKSWWGGSENQAYRDLYNLMPCEKNINSSKSNYPMGTVTRVNTDNGCTKVGTGNNGYKLWEPADRWKGDFARGYMYMATAYQDFTWKGEQALQILRQGAYPTLQEWAYTLYIEWAKGDGVDEIEVKRNNEVYKIQGNRNPFVDFPNLMEYIWGDSTDYAFDPRKTVCTDTYDNGGGGITIPTEETIYAAVFTTDGGGCTTEQTLTPYEGYEVWTRDAKYGWKGTAFYSNTKHEADATLLTPMIDLTEYGEATLTFNHAVNFCANPGSVLAVEVVCDGQRMALDGIAWPAGNSWTFRSSGDISLGSFAGKKIKIAFHYRSTTAESATWEIKEMTVNGKRRTSGISQTTTDRTMPDMNRPYEMYNIDGRRIAPADEHRGIVIIRQDGKTWKTKR